MSALAKFPYIGLANPPILPEFAFALSAATAVNWFLTRLKYVLSTISSIVSWFEIFEDTLGSLIQLLPNAVFK